MSFALLMLLFAHFLAMSLLAIGGGVVLIPEVHRLMVEELKLMSDGTFTGAVALAQAAPGPNVLFVAVVGYRAAGLAGALACMLGVMLPASALTLLATRWLRAHQSLLGVQAFKLGLSPLVIGLMCASGWTLATETPGTRHVLLTVLAALLVWRTRVHLLLLLALGALVGVLGWI